MVILSLFTHSGVDAESNQPFLHAPKPIIYLLKPEYALTILIPSPNEGASWPISTIPPPRRPSIGPSATLSISARLRLMIRRCYEASAVLYARRQARRERIGLPSPMRRDCCAMRFRMDAGIATRALIDGMQCTPTPRVPRRPGSRIVTPARERFIYSPPSWRADAGGFQRHDVCDFTITIR